MDKFNTDPTFHGNQKFSDVYRESSVVTIGSSNGQWQDDTINGAFNSTITRVNSPKGLINLTAGANDYCVKFQALSLGLCKASFRTTVVDGVEYEFWFKYRMASTPANIYPSSIGYTLGKTSGSADYISTETLHTAPPGSEITDEWLTSTASRFIADGTDLYITFICVANQSDDNFYISDLNMREKYATWTDD
jgi:hypothetical protein